jgi:non-heme chloroperoxidase
MVQSVTLRNGITLEYVAQGDPSGFPLLLLHGVTDSWRSFEPVLPHLPTSVRALAVSQRGHGGSSRLERDYRFVDFSEDVEMFLDALGIGAALIVGHSMGSWVAQRFAIDHPERTLGVVLMGSSSSLRGSPVVEDLWQSAVAQLTDPVDPDFILEFQKSTLVRPIPPSFLDMVVRESQKVPAHVWRATFEQFLQTDFSNELPIITAPTLIAWGDQDVIFRRAGQEILLKSIPSSQLIVYSGGGHTFHWEDPERFSLDLVAFVRERQERHGLPNL